MAAITQYCLHFCFEIVAQNCQCIVATSELELAQGQSFTYIALHTSFTEQGKLCMGDFLL